MATLRKLSDLTRLQSDLDQIRARLEQLENAETKKPEPGPLTCKLCGFDPVEHSHTEQSDTYYTHQVTKLHCPKCGWKDRDTHIVA
jgi:predicted RNA-binding Zn-ribbon protein involved in translation (DUF1610 family)